MANIRKITLMSGEIFVVGGELWDGKEKYHIESIYPCYIPIESELLPGYRIYVEERDSPYLEIPYHAIRLVFYS